MTNAVPQIVIIGGGFGGLKAAQQLAKLPVHITLIDRNNHHTFQPFLYQVAMTVLSPAQIATPLRTVFRGHDNVDVIMSEVKHIDMEDQTVQADGHQFAYDYLIVAAGARHSYFGRNEWEKDAPGLKTIEDAVELRRRILLALEIAERDAVAAKHSVNAAEPAPINFVVVGGGPTGLETSGALASIIHTLRKDFHGIDPERIRVILASAGDRLLPSYPPDLSHSAEAQLRNLGVEVMNSSRVTEVGPQWVRIGDTVVPSAVTVWATGVAASPLGKQLSNELDTSGRVPVFPDLALREHGHIFVIGDMASAKGEDGKPLPGLASVAEQQGAAVAANIKRDLNGKPRRPFRYRDWGSMAVIGRCSAVVHWGRLHVSKTLAWIIWALIHAGLLSDFRSRGSVLREWTWSLLTRKTSARLITGSHELQADARRQGTAA